MGVALRDGASRNQNLNLRLFKKFLVYFGANYSFFASKKRKGSRIIIRQEKGRDTNVSLPVSWWTIKDSNLGPTGYEPGALTN